jgi:hypothetical protein
MHSVLFPGLCDGPHFSCSPSVASMAHLCPAGCFFCALIVTPALPILDLQKFICPDVEKTLPAFSKSSTCSASVLALSLSCEAVGMMAASNIPG